MHTKYLVGKEKIAFEKQILDVAVIRKVGDNKTTSVSVILLYGRCKMGLKLMYSPQICHRNEGCSAAEPF